MNQIAFHKYFFCFPIKTIDHMGNRRHRTPKPPGRCVFYCRANEKDDS